MRVLFFAQLKDVTGCNALDIAPASPLNREGLWAALLEKYPDLANYRSCVRLARNCEYAAPEAMFSLGDEVALLPPVSGG
jgi:molybdopterin converting factor subunit 1